MIDHHKVEVSVSGIELLALKKLSLVSHALASKFGDYRAKEEQTCLATVLDDVIRRMELALSARSASEAPTRAEAVNPNEALPVS